MSIGLRSNRTECVSGALTFTVGGRPTIRPPVARCLAARRRSAHRLAATHRFVGEDVALHVVLMI